MSFYYDDESEAWLAQKNSAGDVGGYGDERQDRRKTDCVVGECRPHQTVSEDEGIDHEAKTHVPATIC